VFNDTLARLTTGDGTFHPNPSYNHATGFCSNSYCHGSWVLPRASSSYAFIFTDSVMSGNNYQPRWNNGTGDAACGTCHGLPPAGHSAATLSACANCHTGVVNSSGSIIDKTKHINGKINAFNTERPF
jgi:predicted CxxxxCH...CXXCH cytochrome family protein